MVVILLETTVFLNLLTRGQENSVSNSITTIYMIYFRNQPKSVHLSPNHCQIKATKGKTYDVQTPEWNNVMQNSHKNFISQVLMYKIAEYKYKKFYRHRFCSTVSYKSG